MRQCHFGESIVNLIEGAVLENAFMVSSDEEDVVEEIDDVALLGNAFLGDRPNMRPFIGVRVDRHGRGRDDGGGLVRCGRNSRHLRVGDANGRRKRSRWYRAARGRIFGCL